MVSRYGEKFDKAVDKTLKVKVVGRTLFLIAAVIAFAVWSVFFGLAVGSEDDWDEASVRLWAALIALPYILPISIFLYVGLNKRGAIITYKGVTERTLGIARYLGEDTKALQKEFKARRKAKDKAWIINTANKYYDECERLKSEMSSRYGEKFEKSVNGVINAKLKLRSRLVIISILLFVVDIFVTCILMLVPCPTDSNYVLMDCLDAKLSEAGINMDELMIIFGALMFIFIFIIVPVIIVLWAALNKRLSIINYKRVIDRTTAIAGYLGENEKQLRKEFAQRLNAEDMKWIINTTNKYYDECERLKAEKLAEHAAEKAEKGEGGFDGWMIQKWAWMLLGLIVTVATLGICFPVAYVWILKWEAKHSLYDGKRLSFDGKASSLVGKWICWILLIIPTIGIYALFIPKKLLQWKASHTHIEGEMSFLGGTWDGSAILLILNKIGCSLFSAITLGTLKPIAICWRKRFIQNRLMIDGRPMSFDGNGAEILGKWVVWNILTYITLGIYALFRNARLLKWVNKHTHIEAEIKQIKVI